MNSCKVWTFLAIGLFWATAALSAQSLDELAAPKRWHLSVGADAKGMQLFSPNVKYLRDRMAEWNGFWDPDGRSVTYQNPALVCPEVHIGLRYDFKPRWFVGAGLSYGLWRFKEWQTWHYPNGNAFSPQVRSWSVNCRTNLFMVSMPLSFGWQTPNRRNSFHAQLIPHLLVGGNHTYWESTTFADAPEQGAFLTQMRVSSKPVNGNVNFGGVSRASLAAGLRYEYALPFLKMPLALGLGVEYGLTPMMYQTSSYSVVGWWWGGPEGKGNNSTYGCVNLGIRWEVW